MRKLLLVLLLLAAPAAAQCQTATTTTTPTQANPFPEQKFTIQGKVAGLSVGGTQLIAADAVACIGISQSVQLREDNILISLPTTSTPTTTNASAGPLGSIFLAGVQPNLPNLFPKTSFLGGPNFQWYALGQMGVSRSGANQTIAESAGLGLNYRPSTSNPTSINIFELAWVHGSIPIGANADGTPKFGNNAIRVSVGIGF